MTQSRGANLDIAAQLISKQMEKIPTFDPQLIDNNDHKKGLNLDETLASDQTVLPRYPRDNKAPRLVLHGQKLSDYIHDQDYADQDRQNKVTINLVELGN